MVVITLKLIVLKKSESFNFTVFVLFCLIVTEPYYGQLHIFCGDLQVILFSFRFIWRYADFVIKFCLLKRT